jgi:hypothetical protein
MAGHELDLAYRLLDLDLVDSEDVRCGKVDDLDLQGEPGETTYVAAIVSGPAAMPARLPRRLRRFGARFFRGGETRIGWDEVDDFDSAIELRSTARELGLGEGDRKVGALMPGGDG